MNIFKLNPHTKEEQLDAIEYAIKALDSTEHHGLCWHFRKYHMKLGGDFIFYDTLPTLFPDIFDTKFAKKKYSEGNGYWWDNKYAYRNRIKYLNTCKKKLNETRT